MPKRNRSATYAPHPGYRVGTCPACGKQGYTSKKEAKRGAKRAYPGARMRFYQCGTVWHMTSADAKDAANISLGDQFWFQETMAFRRITGEGPSRFTGLLGVIGGEDG